MTTEKIETTSYKLDNLPSEIIFEILSNLSLADEGKLACVSRFFNNHIKAEREKRLIPQLLQWVAKGNEDRAEKLLKIRPDLMLTKGTVIDPSGRIFRDISPFEYAVWALDGHMWTMMMGCIPEGEQGLLISCELLRQLNFVDGDGTMAGKGLEYELNGQKFKKNHYDFRPLIIALQTYVNSYGLWDQPQRAHHWCTVVGGAQRIDGKNDGPPAHVWDEFFLNRWSFDLAWKLNRGERMFRNIVESSKRQQFGPHLDNLGFSFALMAGVGHCVARADAVGRADRAKRDMKCLTALCEARTHHDLPELRLQLENLIHRPENPYLVP